ncbi:hypothetical protein V6N12_004755 [Hibiscus sabdariffa]|uniref:Maturase K n=1 Tax=Hibiscus sabdariffa TaxID=183260 RepID=A0ABR2CMG1_9ROSI
MAFLEKHRYAYFKDKPHLLSVALPHPNPQIKPKSPNFLHHLSFSSLLYQKGFAAEEINCLFPSMAL